MTGEEELAPALADLERVHDVLPFLDRQLPIGEVAWKRMPDDMVDLLATSPDFRPPEAGGRPVWLQLEGEGGGNGVVIVARPRADGELWVVAPARRAGDGQYSRGN